MDESPYGLSQGFGVELFLIYNEGILLNYAYRDHATLGDTHTYEIAMRF